MKIKDGFMLRSIADSWIVVPLGQRVVEFNGLMTLSESGALLWSKLEKGTTETELVDTLLAEYNVDELTARTDVQVFLASIAESRLFE